MMVCTDRDMLREEAWPASQRSTEPPRAGLFSVQSVDLALDNRRPVGPRVFDRRVESELRKTPDLDGFYAEVTFGGLGARKLSACTEEYRYPKDKLDGFSKPWTWTLTSADPEKVGLRFYDAVSVVLLCNERRMGLVEIALKPEEVDRGFLSTLRLSSELGEDALIEPRVASAYGEWYLYERQFCMGERWVCVLEMTETGDFGIKVEDMRLPPVLSFCDALHATQEWVADQIKR